VFLFAQLRVASQLPQLVAVSSVILLTSIVLVTFAELGRQRSERRYAGQFAEA
jgi:heme/copper-type cytochrome/quinol oxidase subunit 3